MDFFRIDNNRLIREFRGEQMRVEPWGENSLRVRATRMMKMDDSPLMQWALLAPQETRCDIRINGDAATITNGKLSAIIDRIGKITFYNQAGAILLEEFKRTKEDMSGFCLDLNIQPRIHTAFGRRLLPVCPVRSSGWRKALWHGAIPAALPRS